MRRHGYKNEKVDQLILAAQASSATRTSAGRCTADVDSLINQDLPLIYTHFVPLMQAGTKR